MDVLEELLHRLVQHRTAPEHGAAFLHEVPDRNRLEIVRDGRHDHFVDRHRALMDTEHAGDRKAVDIGVDNANLKAELLERDREVDRHRGLANATLARGDGNDTRLGRNRERAGGGWGAAATQAGCERRALVFGHAGEVHEHARDTFDRADLTLDIAVDRGLQRAAGDCERHTNGDVPTIDRDGANHLELDQIFAELRVDDAGHRLADLGLSDSAHLERRLP